MPSYPIVAVGIAALALRPEFVRAEEVGTAGACPSRDAIAAAVESALGKPLPDDELNLIVVADFGDSYTIRIGDRVREYTDESRDCAKRARIAAVFVALTLAPPDIGSEPQTPASDGSKVQSPNNATNSAPTEPTKFGTAATPTESPVLASMPGAWRAGTELSVRANMAPRSGQAAFDVGGQLQFIYSSSSWGITFGVYVPTSSTLEFDYVRVRQTRYAGFAGLRKLWHLRGLRSNIDVCASTAMLRIRQDTPNANPVTRAEPALHVGNAWSLDEHWVSPFVGVYAELVPLPISIAVEPRGVIGHSSAVWVGLAMGVSLGQD